jgi:hypothetical protein
MPSGKAEKRKSGKAEKRKSGKADEMLGGKSSRGMRGNGVADPQERFFQETPF